MAQATGKEFEMGPNFCLGDLLKLELHNAVEVCREIVDRAQKELIIEKALTKIDSVWAGLALTFTPFQVCGCAAVSVCCCGQHSASRAVPVMQGICWQHTAMQASAEGQAQ